jgi:hypothetical protein
MASPFAYVGIAVLGDPVLGVSVLHGIVAAIDRIPASFPPWRGGQKGIRGRVGTRHRGARSKRPAHGMLKCHGPHFKLRRPTHQNSAER